MFDKFIHAIIAIFESMIMVISMISPRSKKIIIFGAWWGDKYDDNSRALFEYALNCNHSIKVYWLTPNDNIVSQLNRLGYPVINSHSLKAVWITLRAGYVCFCTSEKDIGRNLVKYLGGCILINLWHGVVSKKILFDDHVFRKKPGLIGQFLRLVKNETIKSSYVVCTSEIYYPIFESAFKTTRDRILNIGQARNDYFFLKTPNIFREKYRGKKIIVYMPTHRQQGQKYMNMYCILDLPTMNAVLEKYNSVLIIKKHFYHRAEPSIGSEYNNIVEVTNDNVETPVLLKAADVLITDYSSCYNDFLLLNRPQIFFCYDMDDYLLNDREMYFDYYSNVPGPICKNNSDLIKELDDVLSGVDNYKEKRQQQLDFFYSKENQGIVAPRQLETILSL